MSQNNVGLLPVVNKKWRIDWCYIVNITAEISNKANLDSPVQNYMKTNPITLGYKCFCKGRYRYNE